MTETTVTEQGYAPPSDRRRPKPSLGALIVASPLLVEPQPLEVPRALTLGRDDGADVVVHDAGISRLHARLTPRGNALLVEDLGSHNGTYVNGERLWSAGVTAPPGTVVRMGRTVLVVTNVAPYAVPRPPAVPGLLGGAALDDARARIATIAATKSPVLVLGETGTGKEVVARQIHEHSGRRGEFVALNSAALPLELVDAELFGHAKGAFSGASGARQGQFRAADGGTLFLDEIGEMPVALQVKLLRALESDEVRALGEDRSERIDVRVIAATNRGIEPLVEAGAFRADLLHRLSGFRISLPPLRERREDVAVLARHFSASAGSTISAAALGQLMLHPFPGNVRELKNIVIAAAHLTRQQGAEEIAPDTIAELLAAGVELGQADDETRRVAAALEQTRGDVAAAAAALGTSRSVLYEKMRRLKIEPRGFRRR